MKLKAFLLLYICSSSVPRFEHFAAQPLRWLSRLVLSDLDNLSFTIAPR